MQLNVKRVLKEKDMTAGDLAEKLGISQVTMSKHINGNPSVRVLNMIADALGCNLTDLFDDEDGTPTNEIICPNCGTHLHVRMK